MKKVITIAIALLGLLATDQSQAASMTLDSAGRNVTFVDEEGNALLTSDGWVATFWYKQNLTDEYTAIGLAGFMDVSGWYADVPVWATPEEYDGTFFFASKNIITATPSTEYYLSIRIVQLDADELSKLSFDYDAGGLYSASFGDSIADRISDLWDAFGDDANAFNNEGSPLSASSTGATGGNFMGSFGWANGTDVGIVTAVPEPSTWLLLGAGSAFVVIMRRRKKQ